MGWIRSQQGWGVHVALLALVLKLVLAFGHHHFDGSVHQHGQPGANGQAIAHALVQAAQGDSHHANPVHSSGHDDNITHPHDHATLHDQGRSPSPEAQVCFDCMALAAASLAAETPAIKQHQVAGLTCRTQTNNPVHLIHHHAAFRSRAPPQPFLAA